MISEADLRILQQRAGRKGGLQTQLQKKQERLSIYRSKLALRADLQQAQRERNMLQRQYDELALQWEVDRAELVKAHDRLAQQATRIKELEHGFCTPEVSMADATGGTNRRKKRSI